MWTSSLVFEKCPGSPLIWWKLSFVVMTKQYDQKILKISRKNVEKSWLSEFYVIILCISTKKIH